MARPSQCSSQGDNPLDPNYLEPHYREEYRLAIDALAEDDLAGYYHFLQNQGMPDFLAEPEIKHIQQTLQVPHMAVQSDCLYLEGGFEDPDSSSGTYWPMHSDLDAPGLDMGWPNLRSFVGPTEVTTLVNPPNPNTPSIKEQARRLIKSAQQVIAVVMDVFTDVDLFADILDAASRRVAVYILLDELNAHHFVAMVTHCKVNLELVNFMRVRTVAGITYFCRTGKSFKGQVMERFLLVDCRAVLSGNYSFMWSFEKIHRCIAHVFLGELVATFDEEFRILFAQSQPLVLNNAMVPMPGERAYGSTQHRSHMIAPPIMKSMHYLHTEGSLASQHSSYSFDRMDLDRDLPLHLRREDPFHNTMEGSAMQIFNRKFKMEHSLMEPGRSMMTKKMELEAYKRHSFAEGTRESYSSSKQFMKQRVMNNVEEMETQSSLFHKQQVYQIDRPLDHNRQEEPGSGHGIFEKIRSSRMGYQQMEDFPDDSRFRVESQNVVGYQALLDYVPSSASREVKHGSGNRLVSGEGWQGKATQRSQNIGHTYACQMSPTQKQPSDQNQLFHESSLDRQPQDSSVKKGLRKWRISSYLSAYQDSKEEGAQQPITELEAFDDSSQPSEELFTGPEPSVPRFPTREAPKMPSFKPSEPPRFTRMIAPQIVKDSPASGSTSEIADETDSKELGEVALSKHESIRHRLNPMLQRSSRLRSSLIFSSSKQEQHSSSLLTQREQSIGESKEENDPFKPSMIISEILDKRRSITRAPFDFHLTDKSKASIKASPLVELQKVPPPEEPQKVSPPEEPSEVPSAAPTKSMDMVNMNDPNVRLSVFKELAAKRKAAKTTVDSNSKVPEPANKKPAVINNVPKPAKTPEPQPSTHKEVKQPSTQNKVKPAAEVFNTEHQALPAKLTEPPLHKVSSQNIVITDATDSEKRELKRSCSQSSSSLARGESVEKLNKVHGSNTSLNLLDEKGKQDPKAIEFLKKGSQKLKEFLGQKGDKKIGEEVAEVSEEQSSTDTKVESPEAVENKEDKTRKSSQSAPPKSNQNRFISSTSNVLYSSNLRDDTKVILEQISANSQNRIEMAKQASNNKIESSDGSTLENNAQSVSRPEISLTKSRFQKPQTNPEERDKLIKKMDSMRREKRVYSRFEVFYKNKEEAPKSEMDHDPEEDGKTDSSKESMIDKLKLGLFKNKK
ncbi:protein FAM83H-like [Polyodon spathula]|uniref:protein FAM83H-like n=1 Tax=Polyodon spathula TaxID=7913 RepID=UPI001B7F1191|nr:protein FAM83H-like [Polyodon spathula]XP_041100933.1 protein FAM83H-like [Polyodon spathula]XP_041100934.1 protein FAM83H-like [Polyodon spathula]